MVFANDGNDSDKNTLNIEVINSQSACLLSYSDSLGAQIFHNSLPFGSIFFKENIFWLRLPKVVFTDMK